MIFAEEDTSLTCISVLVHANTFFVRFSHNQNQMWFHSRWRRRRIPAELLSQKHISLQQCPSTASLQFSVAPTEHAIYKLKLLDKYRILDFLIFSAPDMKSQTLLKSHLLLRTGCGSFSLFRKVEWKEMMIRLVWKCILHVIVSLFTLFR